MTFKGNPSLQIDIRNQEENVNDEMATCIYLMNWN